MSNTPAKARFGLNSTHLRLLALFFMLLDHMWATVVPGRLWMTCVGRLAFPIFAFQIAEGYAHTRGRKQYLKRMLIFAAVSEIPFDLMMMSFPIFPFHQNVMFTFALGLVAIGKLDDGCKAGTPAARAKGIAWALACVALGEVLCVDYGGLGVATVLLFWGSRGMKYAGLWQLLGMILLHVVAAKGMYIPVQLFGFSFDWCIQGFAVLALPIIWLYNGQKGKGGKWLQYGSYLFYPAHMLLLSLPAWF